MPIQQSTDIDSNDIWTRMRGADEDSGFIQGLKELLACCKPGELAVEIGSYAGQSTQILYESQLFRKIISIDPFIDDYDPSDEPIAKYKLSDVRYLFYKRIMRYDSVMHLNLTSETAATLFDRNSIDFLYIDGNHQYDFVKHDIIKFLPKIKRNGIISGHDYSLFEGVKKAVDEIFGKPSQVFPDSSWLVRL